MERERDADRAPEEIAIAEPATPVKAAKAKPVQRASSQLERLEGEIAAAEERIAGLERKLADDWTNMDVLGAHRAARDELVALLAQWEVLFEDAHAT